MGAEEAVQGIMSSLRGMALARFTDRRCNVFINRTLLLASLAAIVFTALSGASGMVRAQSVPPHLVGMTKSLLNDIESSDFKNIDPKLAAKVTKILRGTRIRSWSPSETRVVADKSALATDLGLDPKKPEHLKIVDEVLAAGDHKQRRAAFAKAYSAARNKPPVDHEVKALEARFNTAMRKKIGDKPTDATIKVDGDAGGEVKISWDPDTSSFVTRIKVNDELDEIYLHGSATARQDGGGLVFDVKADDNPVTRLDEAGRKKLAGAIYGIWKNGSEDWIIRGPDDGKLASPGLGAEVESVDTAMRDIQSLRSEIAKQRKEKAYIWRAPGGGQVIQKQFKRLPDEYEFDRDASKKFTEDKIKPLQQRLRELEQKVVNRPPIVAHDPLRLNDTENLSKTQQPIEIEVMESGGHRYVFDSASFDGERLTARRTLRDVRDISDLPSWVISKLIASFSPPEWVELEARFDPRAKQIRLIGKEWRMHVTYSTTFGNRVVKRIHTPYSNPLVLTYEGDDVLLRVVDLNGAVIETLEHDRPFRVDAQFTRTRDGPVDATLNAADRQGTVLLLPKPDDMSNGRAFESRVLYARSKQYMNRTELKGLFQEKRFFSRLDIDQARKNWQRELADSRSVAQEHYAGDWGVAQSIDGAPGAGVDHVLEGRASIAKDGSSARLMLTGKGGLTKYRSIEMRAQRSSQQDARGFLEIIFERVRDFASAGEAPDREPLPEGRLLYFPTNLKHVSFDLENATAAAAVSLKPAPGDLFHVLLGERRKERLAGAWSTVAGDGSFSSGGRQTWLRGSKVAGAVVVEDQRKFSPPTKAFYPYGRNKDLGSSKRRTLFVWGNGLPSASGDAVAFRSASPGIKYVSHKRSSQADSRTLKQSWKKAGVAQPDDFDSLFITVEFDNTVVPGIKYFALNQMPSGWQLAFADAVGRLQFVDTPPETGVPSDVFYSSDVGHLELIVETEFPFKEPLFAELIQNDGKTQPRRVKLEKLQVDEVDERYRRTYRSKPLHFTRSDRENWAPPEDKTAIILDTSPTTEGDEKTKPTFDARWVEDDRRLAVRPAVRARIVDNPDELGMLWKQALSRAAACYPKVSIDENEKVEEVSAFILTEFLPGLLPKILDNAVPGSKYIKDTKAFKRVFGTNRFKAFRSIDLRLGDHAAALLIRDEFARQAFEKQVAYEKIAASPAKLQEFLDLARRTGGRGDAFWTAGTVKAFSTTFKPKELLETRGGSFNHEMSGQPPEKTKKERLSLLKAALFAYGKDIQASTVKANKAGDCKIEDLMVIAGHPSDTVVTAIMPRLVLERTTKGRTYFEPDNTARSYVRSLYVKGRAVRALEAYAAADDAYKAMALAVVGAGAAAVISGAGYASAATYAAISAEVADGLYFGGKGLLDYQKGEEFYDFAKGGSAVLGESLFDQAKAGRKSKLGTAAGILLPGLGALGSAARLRHLKQVDRGRKVAQRLGRFDGEAMKGLDETARRDLQAYIDTVKEVDALASKAGVRGSAARVLKGTGQKFGDADKAFVKSFDDSVAANAAAVERGANLASKLDDLEPGTLTSLSRQERADLTSFANDVRRRQDRLANPNISGDLKGVSHREADFARTFDDALTKAGDAPKTPASQKVATLPDAARPQIVDELFPDAKAADSQASRVEAAPGSTKQVPSRSTHTEAASPTAPTKTASRDPFPPAASRKTPTVQPEKPTSSSVARTGDPKTVRPARTKPAADATPASRQPARAAAAPSSSKQPASVALPKSDPPPPARPAKQATATSANKVDAVPARPVKQTPTGEAADAAKSARSQASPAPVEPAPGRASDQPASSSKNPGKQPVQKSPDEAAKPQGAQQTQQDWRRRPVETPEDRQRAFDADGLTFKERRSVEKLDQELEKFAAIQKKTTGDLANEATLNQARASLLGRGREYRNNVALLERQIAARDFDLPPDLAKTLQAQRRADDGLMPRRELVAGDKQYVGRVMNGSGIHPTQKDIYASRVNHYVREILRTGQMPPSVKDGVPVVLQRQGKGSELIIANGHHRVVAGKIASRLTGRPLLPSQRVPGSPPSIIPPDQVIIMKAGETVDLGNGRKITANLTRNKKSWSKLGVNSGDDLPPSGSIPRVADGGGSIPPSSPPISRFSELPPSSSSGLPGSPPASASQPRPLTPRVEVPHTIEPVPPIASIGPTPRIDLDLPGSAPASAPPLSRNPFEGPISSRLLDRPPLEKPAHSEFAGGPSAYKPDAIIPVRSPNGPVSGRLNPADDAGRRWQHAGGELRAENKPFAQGGFANAHRMMDAATGETNTGFVFKDYSSDTGKYGKGGRHHDPENPLTESLQKKLVEDTVHGASRLKDAGIMQAEIVDYGFKKGGGWVIQREVGSNLPDGVKQEQVLYNRLREGGLERAESEAVAELFEKLDRAGIAWEDPNRGNIFLRTYNDGRVEAGILDTDRIGLWSDIDPKRDSVLLGFMSDYSQHPGKFSITSMRPSGPGIRFKSAREFNQKVREAKGYWKYNEERGFYGGHLDGYTMRKYFPDLPNSLPPGWSRQLNLDAPPPKTPRGKQGRLLIVPNAPPPNSLALAPAGLKPHRQSNLNMAA